MGSNFGSINVNVNRCGISLIIYVNCYGNDEELASSLSHLQSSLLDNRVPCRSTDINKVNLSKQTCAPPTEISNLGRQGGRGSSSLTTAGVSMSEEGRHVLHRPPNAHHSSRRRGDVTSAELNNELICCSRRQHKRGIRWSEGIRHTGSLYKNGETF